MSIAYVTHYDSRDIRNWSGTGHFIGRELERQGLEIHRVGPLQGSGFRRVILKHKWYSHFTDEKFMGEVDRRVLESYSRDAQKKVDALSPDLIVSPHTASIAYLEPKCPLVLWVDCTFASMVDFYADYTGLCDASLRDGEAAEREAFGKCSLAIFASEWAAHSAVDHYGMDPKKTAVVPFGANILSKRNDSDIERAIAARPAERCNLLFIGKVWERKGGDLAMQVAARLNDSGLPTTLTLVGSVPPAGTAIPDYVRPLGFISKETDAGQQKIESLFSESHFLIVPSRAEAYGIVFCEASSFGVPSLSTNVGGIPTVIREGRNGRTFAPTVGADLYSRYILNTMSDPQCYRELAHSSFQEFQTRLNWQTATARVKDLIQQL